MQKILNNHHYNDDDERLALQYSKNLYKARVITQWHRDREIYQWNRIESIETDICILGIWLMKEVALQSSMKKNRLINWSCSGKYSQ